MAAGKSRDGPLEKGSKILVLIEEALPNVVMVCLKHGSTTYRGALMESNHGEGPYGVNFNRDQVQAANQPLRPPEVLVVDPNREPGQARVSSLPLRHTYLLDPNAVDPKLLPPPPRRDISRPLRDKNNVRAMRLRPRKVLCSNCKEGIHDSNGKSAASNAKSGKTEGATEGGQQTAPAKRRPEPEPDPTPPRKSRRLDNTEPAKTVPVLKISFATPKGGGTVLKIPTQRILALGGGESENFNSSDSDATALTHQQYRKMKKALKKAKLKEKSKTTGSEGGQIEANEKSHHKKSKHNKHKLKKKHKHKDDEPKDKPDLEKQEVSDPKDGILAEKQDDNISPQQNSDSQNADSKIETTEKFSISNADEFTIKKSVVRLTKLNLDENQSHVPCQPAQEEEAPYPSAPQSPANPDSSSDDDDDDDDDDNTLEDSRLPRGEDESKSNDSPNTLENSGASTYHVEVSDISDADDDDSPPSSHLCPPFSPDSYLSSNGVPGQAALGQEPYQPSLMMRIQTKNVISCELPDGRVMNCGDIVWGKIHGFPWWPGRLVTITESLKDSGVIIAQMAHVSWFGSSTMSYMDCTELFPFLEYYKLRFNKKKKGPYKTAIKQATLAAQAIQQADPNSSLDPCKSPLSELDNDSMLDGNSDTMDQFDNMQDMDDLQSLQSLDKENVEALDSLSHHDLIRDGEYEGDMKKIDEDSLGKVENLNSDQLNNMENLENYSLQINQDIALEMMED